MSSQMKNDPCSYDHNFCNCVKKHRYREVMGSSPVEVLNFFFRLLYAIAKIAIITARIILHLISYPQFTYDLFHMHHSKCLLFHCRHMEVMIRMIFF